MSSGSLKRAVTVMCLLGAALTPGAAKAGGTSWSPATACQNVNVSVALAAGLPATERVSGTLCLPPYWARGLRSVEVLVHGASYNRLYWDWPTRGYAYSYVRPALAAGRATFHFDRLGYGQSSRPPSFVLNVATTSYVVHQVIQSLRAPPHAFSDVTLTGHSIGAEMALATAATYPGIDRLILTGYLHRSGEAFPEALASTYPAALDPKFALQGYDPGYLTTQPGTRAALFFYVPGTSPQVIADDERLKDVFSAPELQDAYVHILTPAPLNEAQAVDVPVLMVLGQQDRLFCGVGLDCTDTAAVRAFEQPYFGQAPDFDLYTVPQTGHDLALHNTALLSSVGISAWILSHQP